MFLSSRKFATFRVFFFTCVRRRRKMKPSSLSTKISSTTCERFGKSKAQQIERLQKSSQRTGREGKSSNCRSSRNETEKKILGKTKNEAEDKEPFKKVRSDPRAVATPSARERHYFPSTARFQTLPYGKVLAPVSLLTTQSIVFSTALNCNSPPLTDPDEICNR